MKSKNRLAEVEPRPFASWLYLVFVNHFAMTINAYRRTTDNEQPTTTLIMDRKFWLLRGLRFFFFAALFIAAGFATQALWNWLMPALFRLPAISLGQTFGLLLLSRILFGGFRGGGCCLTCWSSWRARPWAAGW